MDWSGWFLKQLQASAEGLVLHVSIRLYPHTAWLWQQHCRHHVCNLLQFFVDLSTAGHASGIWRSVGHLSLGNRREEKMTAERISIGLFFRYLLAGLIASFFTFSPNAILSRVSPPGPSRARQKGPSAASTRARAIVTPKPMAETVKARKEDPFGNVGLVEFVAHFPLERSGNDNPPKEMGMLLNPIT